MFQVVKLVRPYEGLEIYRGEKILYGKLLSPHLVISTCRTNGGIREDISYVANHQACEPKACPGHEHEKCLAVRDPEAYHRLVCEYHGLPAERTVLLGTAANMNLAGFAEECFRDLIVFCVATAGVETNAGRAGDPANIYEHDGVFEHLSYKNAGTINIMLFINQELTPGALVRTVKMATEAKTTVFEELHVPSRYSEGRATGTGTDQIAVASLFTERPPLRAAGKHVKLGELIARTVRKAVFQALGLQNKRSFETIRYVPRLLERFGLGEEALFKMLRDFLPEKTYTWLYENRRAVLSDTQLIGQVLAYIHLMDQVAWGVIPIESSKELFLAQAALICAVLSGKLNRVSLYHQRLEPLSSEPKKLLVSAIALGFKEKWDVPYFKS